MTVEPPATEFWGLLKSEEAADFLALARERRWPRGAVIFHEFDESDSVLVLVSGRVKAYSSTGSGTEVMLAVREPGALVGELAAIDQRPRSATVEALEPVSALVLPLGAFQEYLRAHGRVALLLAQTLADRLRDADRKRLEFGAHDTLGRVAARLVELADRFGEPTEEGTRIALRLSQDELAGWIGSSREAVAKALQTLRADGTISTSRLTVVVHDLPALRNRASDY
ncbi:Crp/Fnr family transcriptional regulator [Cryptosporangium aurantiacum]|uniref:cAMP-binding domain of CRP or a regulatory subunit of cAMP-dependent protein kinases n=1 Tax=Cryptosporangium aurantiacum TaxID=134849 RepID=A0A1M7RNK1_9ACTN|nr:Crp/Fnr family transcriptional regulator [Cryptosporangium aurantiacum]SHN47834.1 cAMP-binding domain of CRP or a regulatory subunit of cAMP-dependent protein kinases [Cryptosporangium aurantiacum]